jgi:hypothetical protein
MPAYNEWWDDMYVQIEILEVYNPGELIVTCPTSEYGGGSVFLSEPGIYTVPLGGLPAPGEAVLQFHSPPDFGACFVWDCWGLRTAVPVAPEYICGDADGNDVVNVSDIVWMINFVFGEGPAPDPEQAGDVDCNGSVNVSDIVYLINFVFGEGFPPCDADGDGTPDC